MSAKLTVTKLTCNYQDGLAVTAGDIRVGWQMKADTNGDRQTAYRIRIFENITGKSVYDSGKTASAESQLISLPPLKATATATTGRCAYGTPPARSRHGARSNM